MKLLAIVGTNAPNSYNRKLLYYIQRHLKNQADIEIQEIDQIPLYNESMTNGKEPQIVKDLNDKVKAADGVIFGVPEYDHTITSSLKSVIEWLSSTFHPLIKKPVMIVGTSLGNLGTARAQDDLRKILNAPGVESIVLPNDEFLLGFGPDNFDDNGDLRDPNTIQWLEKCFADFQAMIRDLSGQGSLNVDWNESYDVVVIGFGGAGATAARFAADNGSNVLVLDAAPFGHEGGNTRYSDQHVVTGESEEELTKYYTSLNAPFVTPEKTLRAYLHGMVNIHTYFQKYLGINALSWKHDIKPGDAVVPKKQMAEYPELPGSNTIDFALVHKRDKDAALWKLLRQNVLDRKNKIDVWLNTRAKHLIQEPGSKIIRGVQVDRHGQIINIHANNGIVLALGGFENNPKLVETYLHFKHLTPIGTLYNRGDGIKMAQEVGAKMWHMTNYESHGILPGITFAEKPDAQGRQINGWKQLNHGSIFVTSDDGSRYFNEDAPTRHGHIYTHGHWMIPMHNDHPSFVFDQAQYNDFKNQERVDGYLPYAPFMRKLIKRDTLDALAEYLQVPAENLKKTVADFNEAVRTGHDMALGRDTKTMRAFGDGPYYTIAAAADVLNTQGGPQRNEHAEILDVNDKPIPHLYGAGELGGIVANNYQGGGNLTECLVFGKLAGESAAILKSDADHVSVQNTHTNDLVDSENASSITIGPDQYLGSSDAGLGGKVIVRLTYKADRIKNIEVVQHHETTGIGLTAIKKIPKEIIMKNTVNVDTISGASASSRAVKEAVADALKKARSAQTQKQVENRKRSKPND
ncbi:MULTISPECIES: FAD-dependent oxidoreductase [Lactobacillaceae]|nr:FAD-dependent oxidoreductase [Lacticaseibacillus paracasei]MCP9305989.1 FAD-binding protein [Lacticaseibacillus paracasei]MCP9367762.1 FAD-binding protein [Lacticaseibacillus paracasei]